MQADGNGMMVSLIQSNYEGFGSGLVAPGTGFALQDRGALFSLDPSAADVYAPGKRPFHTIIPGFVFKQEQPWLSFGVMGGNMQPQGHAQILANLVDFGMNVQVGCARAVGWLRRPRRRFSGAAAAAVAVQSWLLLVALLLLVGLLLVVGRWCWWCWWCWCWCW
jgi:gamma-glutamyltranspeptidase